MNRVFHVLPHAMTIGEYLTWSRFRCAREQRDYQWQKDQVETFCNDLLEFRRRQGTVDALPIYFVGQVILSRQSSDLLLFDGLQRTTTLTLIAAWLRDRIDDVTVKARLTACIDDDRGGYRLVLPGDDDSLTRLAQQPGATTRDHRGGRRYGRNIAIERNLRVIDGALSILRNEAERIDFATVLLDKVELIALQIPNGALAERMFAKINGTGLRLSPYDLVKSRLIEFARSEDEAKAFVTTWDRVRNIVHTDFEQFLHDALSTANPGVAAPGGVPDLEAFLTWAKGRHLRDEKGLFVWLRFLERAAPDWMALNQVAKRGRTLRTELKELLPLSKIDSHEWRPFALAVYSRFGTDARRTEKQKRTLASVFARLQARVALMSFAGVNDRTRSWIFAKAIRNLRNNADPGDVVDELVVRDVWVARVRRVLNEPINDMQLRRSIFQYLELQTAPSALTLEYFTIEHVLPVTPLDDSRWLQDFPDPDERSRLTDLIGNFMGVPYAVNERLGRLEFEDKQKILQAETGPWKNWVTAQGVADASGWTREAIEARTLKIGQMVWDALKLPEAHSFRNAGREIKEIENTQDIEIEDAFTSGGAGAFDEPDITTLFDQPVPAVPEGGSDPSDGSAGEAFSGEDDLDADDR